MPIPKLTGTLPNVEAFCRTYETGSFTKAARALSVTPQATSRSVARLEELLGVTLFRRTTRSLMPTDAAHCYYERCTQALSLLAAGEREVTRAEHAPAGRVRISAPTTYGHHRLIPWLGEFREQYPKIEVELDLSNRTVDFVRDGFDLAVRMGVIRDKTLVARKLGDFGIGVYGSPAYVARCGQPRTPDDLAEHVCLAFVMPRSGKFFPWSFTPGPKVLVPNGVYRCSEDALAVVGLARAGVGLTQFYDFVVEPDLTRGTLVEVLAAHRGAARSFSLLRPQGVVLSASSRALSDFIAAKARARDRTAP